VVGAGMRSHAGVAARIFSTLSNIGINIIMISTSEIRVSCIIDKQFTEKAVHALHDEFKLYEEPTPVSQSATGTSPTA
jgi:aspartate kinase